MSDYVLSQEGEDAGYGDAEDSDDAVIAAALLAEAAAALAARGAELLAYLVAHGYLVDDGA